MRDGDRESWLKVLGLGPGASAQEIKAAYRDLAKVWHPDRFAHDPRLQQKAQEQLKAINEAYRRLASGDYATPGASAPRSSQETHRSRPTHDADVAREPRPAGANGTTTEDARVATRPHRKVNRLALAAPALAFCATFAFVTPRLLPTVRAPGQSGDAAAAVEPAIDEYAEPARQQPDSNSEARVARPNQKPPATAQRHATLAAESATAAAAARPARALPTVTVSIDPTTGLRARPACPHKTAMTFPAGGEPSGYCDAAHNPAVAPQRAAADATRANGRDESRLKSFAGRVSSPARKLFGGRRSADKASADSAAAARN